jgi:arylsulfatase A-like enzyme
MSMVSFSRPLSASFPRLRLTAVGALIVIGFVAGARAAEPAGRPNVVVILTDDQGWGDLSVHGNTNLSTPRIDSLARDGALFERFFVCPVCSPTRAEFLTGRYHPRGGVFSTSTGGERLDLDERTIADVFKASGYATGAFGKWHNGSQWPYHPSARGFDEYYGFTSGHWGNYFDPPLDHNGKLVTGRGFIIDDFTDHAIEFIEKNRERPFFCYVPFNTPHSPMQVPDKYYAKFKDADLKLRADERGKEDLEHTRAALAMCENIDFNVGRILDKLAEAKLAENTIVLYFCDNGPNGARWNGGMKGRKGSTDEGGVRSPLLVRWPARIAAGTKIRRIAGAIDLLPTLAAACGIDLEVGNAFGLKPLDGMNYLPTLNDPAAPFYDRQLFSHWNGKVSVRTQRFRLDADGKLFDLEADPEQRKNVADAHPQVAKALKDAVAKFRSDVLSELDPKAERPYPVGYREAPTTFLPARDGMPHGTVERSAKAPNCSYFTHWTRLDDSITWDVDVATAGRYEAIVHYTCAAKNVGAKIEVSLGEGRTAIAVTEAHDPPAYGKEHDRHDRGTESFVKDFKPLSLGELTLAKGRGTLTLKALEKPGPEVIEVRMVELRLLP